jgi:hypothetical protein
LNDYGPDVLSQPLQLRLCRFGTVGLLIQCHAAIASSMAPLRQAFLGTLGTLNITLNILISYFHRLNPGHLGFAQPRLCGVGFTPPVFTLGTEVGYQTPGATHAVTSGASTLYTQRGP